MQSRRRPFFVFGQARAEVAFAGGASHHQKLHGKESRKTPLHFVDNAAHFSGNAFTNILPNKKERLNGANFSGGIFQDEILIAEVGFERLRDDFVKTMVLAFIAKCSFPRVDVV